MQKILFYAIFKKGIWIGKRKMEVDNYFPGISICILDLFNLNLLHYAIRIDGKFWHLAMNKTGKQLRVVECNENVQNYQWFYKGQRKAEMDRITNFIQFINSVFIRYDLFISNCQDTAKAIAYFASSKHMSDINGLRFISGDAAEKYLSDHPFLSLILFLQNPSVVLFGFLVRLVGKISQELKMMFN